MKSIPKSKMFTHKFRLKSDKNKVCMTPNKIKDRKPQLIKG